MRHPRTPAQNFLLANAYLDVLEGLMTREEAIAYLCAQYEDHPSPRSVSSSLGAARRSYQNLTATRRRAKDRTPASDLEFEMRLAIEQRGGD